MRSSKVRVSATLLLAVSLGVAACGSNPASDASDATEVAGEYEIVADSVVAQGLTSTSTTMTALAAAPETATADAVVAVFQQWAGYEGTIKQNQPDSYIDLEDALGAFKKSAESGDAVGMQTAITAFGDIATQYLAAYPG